MRRSHSFSLPLCVAALMLAPVRVEGYQTMVVTFDILPPEEAGEPSAENVAQQLAAAVSSSEPLNHPFRFDNKTEVQIEHRSQESIVEVKSKDDIHVAAGGRLETKARALFGRFVDDVDVVTTGAQFRAAEDGVELFSSRGANVQVGGAVDGVVGNLKATATGSAGFQVHKNVDGHAMGSATLSASENGTLSAGGSAEISVADSLWVSSGHVGIESAANIDVTGSEVTANGAERVSVATLGSAVELVGMGDVEYIGFVWRSSPSFYIFGALQKACILCPL